ncbi:MAG: Sua5/YciO/YrdC/YwlC family protein [Gemmatimonadaceae bacterium]
MLLHAAHPSLDIVREVAPGHDTIGVLLPYTPLHTLLVAPGPLVLTSGNASEEPIARANDEARTRLGGMADAFLVHDRDIHVVCDDLVRVVGGQRRSHPPLARLRPLPVLLLDLPMSVAVGAELKATACVTRDRHAILSQHIGDLGNLETLQAMEQAVDHLLRLFRVTCAPRLRATCIRATSRRDGVNAGPRSMALASCTSTHRWPAGRSTVADRRTHPRLHLRWYGVRLDRPSGLGECSWVGTRRSSGCGAPAADTAARGDWASGTPRASHRAAACSG